MPKQNLSEQLDRMIGAVIALRDAALPKATREIAPLLQIAAQLRGLPRAEFRARLKSDLQRGMTMQSSAAPTREETTKKVNPIREGFHTITPYVIVKDAAELIDFVKQAFGAEEIFRGIGSAGGIHAEVRIGDSMLMLGGGGAWHGTPQPTSLHLYVPDVDSVYEKAVRAGAVSIAKPIDQPYGDREAGVKDLAGNDWYIATHKGASYVPEGLHSVNLYLHPRGAVRMIDFLKNAFGAALTDRAEAPDGTVVHAKMRIGTSTLELGEAHGAYQPKPTAIYMYVDDVDAVYKLAIGAGGIGTQPPADQPYGDRNGWVKDPFGNDWFISTHIKDA